MNDAVPALTLWFLTAIRLSVLKNPRARVPFWGSLFAAIALTLYEPWVYKTIDPLLGGGNMVGLVLSLSMVTSLWLIQRSIADACGQTRHGRRLWFLGWLATLLTMAASFPFWHAPATTRDLVSVYGTGPGLLVFLIVACCFIGSVSFYGTRMAYRNLKMMSPAFRAGFRLVSIGFLIAMPLLTVRVLANFAPAEFKSILESRYELGQQIVVLLVSIGLSLPRLRTLGAQLVLSLQARYYLLVLRPAWAERAAAYPQLVVDKRPYGFAEPLKWNSIGRLNRRLAELRDLSTRYGFEDPRTERMVHAAEAVFMPLYGKDDRDAPGKVAPHREPRAG